MPMTNQISRDELRSAIADKLCAHFGVTAENARIDQAAVVARKNKVVKTLVSGVGAAMKAAKVEVKTGLGEIVGRDAEGVVRVTGDAGLSQILAGIEVALSVLLFTACSVYIRLRLRVLPPKPKKGATA